MRCFTVGEVSTEHITPADAAALSDCSSGHGVLMAIPTGYGWVVFLPTPEGFSEWDADAADAGLSAAMRHLVHVATIAGHNWLSIDQDAPPDEDLPKFTW